MSYDNPPLKAALVAPVTLLPFRTAVVTSTVLSGFFLLTSLWLILGAGGQDLLRYPQWVLALILALNFGPIHHSLALGQFDLFIPLLLALVYWAYKDHRDILAGCSLGLAAMLKFSPVLLVLFFLLKRRYRIFFSAVGVMAVIAVQSWAIAGTDNWTFFIADILPALLGGCAHPENQSLSAFFSRLFVGEYYITDYVPVPHVPQARLLTLFASLSLVAASAWLVRKKVLSRDDPRFDLQFALVVIALPLLSTIA
jgi:alpha-1,2-mannosyltransferase